MPNNDATKQERPILTNDAERLRFVAIENRVHDNLRRLVCRARSNNMADRIANALNHYQVDKRGK